MDSIAAIGPIAPTGGLDLLFVATISGMMLLLYLMWWLITDKSEEDDGSADEGADMLSPASNKTNRRK
jgi:hypothetical protein